MSYTKDQLNVINHPHDNNLVIALPGSGKTHTSIGLAKVILESSPDNKLIMVTFTRASTGETEARVARNISSHLMDNLRVDTFAKLMLDHAKPILAGRKIIMGGEHELLKRRAAIAALSVAQGGIDRQLGYLGADYIEDYLDCDGDIECMHPAGQRYLEMLRQYRKVDLSTLSVELIFALRTGEIEPIDFTHMIVDEFQDTDIIQIEWLKANYQEGRAITVVGDDDQSIYAWRGSRGYKNMEDFQNYFDSKAWLLGDCFRCAPEILKHAERMISYNPESARIPKVMNAVRPKGGKVEFRMVSRYEAESSVTELAKLINSSDLEKYNISESDDEEREPETYAYIAKEIAKNPDGWAVLARTNFTLDNIQAFLELLNIQVRRIGGKSIWEHAGIVGYMSLLSILFDDRKTAALDGALHFVGVDDEQIKQIHRVLLKRKRLSMVTSQDHSDVSEVTQGKLTTIVEWARIGGSLKSSTEELKEFINKQVRPGISKMNKTLSGTQKALDFIDSMLLSSLGTPRERLARIYRRSKTKTNKEVVEGGVIVTLCTMSGSKGLEFPNVWIADCEKGRAPIKAKYIENDEKEEARIEEERRLFYVAMTRAEDRLVMSYREGKASEFLSEASGYDLND